MNQQDAQIVEEQRNNKIIEDNMIFKAMREYSYSFFLYNRNDSNAKDLRCG